MPETESSANLAALCVKHVLQNERTQHATRRIFSKFERERLNKILSKHTKRSVDDILTDTDRDNFMDGKEAVDYGLIDSVIEKRPSTES